MISINLEAISDRALAILELAIDTAICSALHDKRLTPHEQHLFELHFEVASERMRRETRLCA